MPWGNGEQAHSHTQTYRHTHRHTDTHTQTHTHNVHYDVWCVHVYVCRNKLYEIACESWGQGDDEMRQKMSKMASAAAWGLGEWENMEEYVHSMPNNSMDYPLLRSVLHIHHGQFSTAQKVVYSTLYSDACVYGGP